MNSVILLPDLLTNMPMRASRYRCILMMLSHGKKNITTLANFHGKWEDMIKKGTKIPTPLSKKAKEAVSKVGVFEGAGYSPKGVYRGVQDCRMRINETPEFCIVCKKALQDIIDFYTK